MDRQPLPRESNTLGRASLIASITAIVLVFGIGLCGLVGAAQGWIQLLGTPLYVCGASSAFLGLIGLVLGVAGLFGRHHTKGTAVVGLLLGLGAICLFLGVLRAVGG